MQELQASQEAHLQLQSRLADLDGLQASSVREKALEQQLAEAQRLTGSLQEVVDRLQQVQLVG